MQTMPRKSCSQRYDAGRATADGVLNAFIEVSGE
jgi:hypothetical protein